MKFHKYFIPRYSAQYITEKACGPTIPYTVLCGFTKHRNGIAQNQGLPFNLGEVVFYPFQHYTKKTAKHSLKKVKYFFVNALL